MNEKTSASLHFAGDLEVWQGLLLALALGALAWWLYRLETRKGTGAPLNWLLPLLRGAAVTLIVLILVGPTVRLETEKGQRGRVTIFVDASESMSIKDEGMSAGRKLLIAERQGWLPADQQLLDTALNNAADDLADARLALSKGLDDGTSDLLKIRKKFADEVKDVAKSLAGKQYEVPKDAETRGSLLREVWREVGGSEVDPFLRMPKSKQAPDATNYLSSAETLSNVGDNYAQRVKGILTPPASGDYLFWLMTNDETVVYLNESGERPENKREILRHKTGMGRAWSERLRSRPITLNKGKRYYFEFIHKEGSGDDFSAVGWTSATGRVERPIPGKYFSAPNFKDAPTFVELLEKMKIDLVENARKLKKGNDETAETTFRDNLLNLSVVALDYENRFRSIFALYAENLADPKEGPIEKVVEEALAKFDKTARWDRVARLLTKREDSILKQFSDTHLIEVKALVGNEAKHLWDNSSDSEPPDSLGVFAKTRRTDLATGLRATIKTDDEEKKVDKGKTSGEPNSAAILLSDGLHNDGVSPLETAKILAGRDIPLHAVGLGSNLVPPDLAVLDVEAPRKVLKDDRVRGNVTLKDNVPAGTPFKMLVEDDQGKVFWEKEFAGLDAKRRRIAFDFSIKEMVEEKIRSLGLGEKVDVNAVPFRMKVRVDPVGVEIRTDNNALSFSFDAITKKNRMLIIDGRPRWETRYIRNLFERDEQWETTSAIAGPGANASKLPRGEKGEVFPSDKNTLFGYDLLIFGEISTDLFEGEELEWVRDFVTQRGGGIIMLDGPRQKFREYAEDEDNPLSGLLPVKWREDGPKRLAPKNLRLTELGKETAALFLEPEPERNVELWGYAPKPGWVAPTENLPGTEVYLEAMIDEQGEDVVPLLVTRPVGAGKVLYAGFDGTWRWRYEVADKYHQRYWHQIASWIMEKPFAVSDEFVAIDPGASTYRPGESADLRVRIRNREGNPLEEPGVKAEAILRRDGQFVATVPLESDPDSGGLYRGTTPGLQDGEHEVTVRVKGLYDEDELRSRVGFLVRETESPELTTLTCNEALLRDMASFSGGRYLREEQIDRLNELLKPISSATLLIVEIPLWQRYWWFVPIVLLLGVELFLRKRAGML
ncbi:MAG: hypothetical protein VB997_10060 [Opitutales bacterium]